MSISDVTRVLRSRGILLTCMHFFNILCVMILKKIKQFQTCSTYVMCLFTGLRSGIQSGIVLRL